MTPDAQDDPRPPWPLRAYRVLIRLLAPRELRDDFGAEMEETFRRRLRATETAFGRVRLLLEEARHLPAALAQVRGRGGREATRAGRFDALRFEIGIEVRRLVRSPTFALLSASVLAAGMTTSTVAFSVVDQVALRALPVDDPERLVDVLVERPGGNSFLGFSHQDVAALGVETSFSVGVAAFSGTRTALRRAGTSVEARVDLVSERYFDVVGVPSALGTTRFPPFQGFGGRPVAVLSHAFWTRQFGADPSVVGSTVELGEEAVDVIGVAREGFSGTFIGFPTDLWLPLGAAPAFFRDFDPEDPDDKRWSAIGRLPPGGTTTAAQAGLNSVAEELERTYPEANRDLRVRVVPATGIDDSLRTAVAAFLALVGSLALVVLLVACLNVGGVLLVRAMHREPEIATRAALGAGRGRIVRQQGIEVALIVLLAALFTAVAVVAVGRALSRYLSTFWGGLGLELTPDWRMAAFGGCVMVLALALSVLVPSLHLTRRSPAAALRSRAISSGRRAVQTTLVVAQVAFSAVLVVTTGLLVQAIFRTATEDPGMEPDLVTVFRVPLDEEGAAAPPADLLRQLVTALEDHPAVTGGVATSLQQPIGLARSPTTVGIEGVDSPPDRPGHVVDVKVVGARYLEVLGTPVVSGRDFTAPDEHEPVPVAVVSRAFAERFWPGLDPIGRTLEISGATARVVGVAADARYIVQDVTPDPLVYLSAAGRVPQSTFVTVRSTASAGEVADAVRAVTATLLPDLPVSPRTGREVFVAAALPQRMGAGLVGTMGLVALLLTATGLYALIQFLVESRTRELGIRLALGDSRHGVVRSVLGRGLAIVGAGTAAGLLVSLWTARVLEPLLIGGVQGGLGVALVVTGLFLLVALAATGPPALRAARVSPVETLRAG